MKGPSYWKAKYEGQVEITENHRLMEFALHERVKELEDRMMATSLAELRAYHPNAMPTEADVDDGEMWATGPFGHDPQKLPPLTEEEAAYIALQGWDQ